MTPDAGGNQRAHIDAAENVLRQVGEQVRRIRNDAQMSRRVLAERSNVSERYLALLESGQGNISIGLLARVAAALGYRIESLFVGDDKTAEEFSRLSVLYYAADVARRREAMALLEGDARSAGRRQRVALIGLRGAGKTTLGPRIAAAFSAPFVELSVAVTANIGLPVNEIIALYGVEGYREMEGRCLRDIVEGHDRLVLSVSGGIVDAPRSFEYLLAHFHTIWLKASPLEHMDRVRRQGDIRPMAGNPRAEEDLLAILGRRHVRYAKAHAEVDTSGRTVDASALEVIDVVRTIGAMQAEPE